MSSAQYRADYARVRANFPPALRAQRRWVCWRYEPDDKGAPTKVPYQADGARKASTTDAATWSGFEQAVTGAQTHGYDGVGYVVGAGVAGIDLDYAIVDGAPKPWADKIVRSVVSYWELSPSGDGAHAFVTGAWHGSGHRIDYADGRIEVYDSGRFFTVTGVRLDDTAPTLEARQDAPETPSGKRSNPRHLRACGSTKGARAMPYLRIPVEAHQARRVRAQIEQDRAAGLVNTVREIDDGDQTSVYVDYVPVPMNLPGTMSLNRTPLPVCYVFKKESTEWTTNRATSRPENGRK